MQRSLQSGQVFEHLRSRYCMDKNNINLKKAYPCEVRFRLHHTRADDLVVVGVVESDHVEDHRLWHGQDDG